MSVVKTVEIHCDICGIRFKPSFEFVANSYGITKGGGVGLARQEAKAVGWKRQKVFRGRRYVWVDCCSMCDPTGFKYGKIWFERKEP